MVFDLRVSSSIRRTVMSGADRTLPSRALATVCFGMTLGFAARHGPEPAGRTRG
jgi:hypothetical protein